MHRHMDVCREHSNAQSDETPCGQHDIASDQQQETESRLRHAADVNQLEMPWQVGRHDTEVHGRVEEVIDAGGDEEYAEKVSADGFEAVHLRAVTPSSRS